MKLLILSGLSAIETLSKQEERIMQAKGPGPGKFLQHELLKSTISSRLSEIAVCHTLIL